jgi:lauroyl/myristoyl acyltransferase
LKENRILVTSFLGRLTGLDRTINVLHKRTGAEMVFAVIHRHSLNRYSFIAHPLTKGPADEPEDRQLCIGSQVLKTLEWYILRYPEQWYQWKNYFSIGGYMQKDTGRYMVQTQLAFQSPMMVPFPDRAFSPLFQRAEV